MMTQSSPYRKRVCDFISLMVVIHTLFLFVVQGPGYS